MVLSLFPAADSVIAGLKGAKNQAGRGFLGPIQTYLRRVLRKPHQFVESKSCSPPKAFGNNRPRNTLKDPNYWDGDVLHQIRINPRFLRY